jgi:hypothetical protein
MSSTTFQAAPADFARSAVMPIMAIVSVATAVLPLEKRTR